MYFFFPRRYFRIVLNGTDERPPRLLDVGSFVYDFNLVYEISRLATDPNYDDFKFQHYIWRRNGRPLRDEDRLYLERFRLASPLHLVAIVAAVPAAVGAVWGTVQIIE